MPAVIDAPEHIVYVEYVETPALLAERPQARGARPGFWYTLTHGITKHLTYRPHVRHAPACHARRPFETPIDRLVREHPALSVYALSLI